MILSTEKTMALRREFSFYCSLLPEEFDLEVYPDCWLDVKLVLYRDGSARFETKTDDAGHVVHESFHFKDYWEKDSFYDDGVKEVRIGNGFLSSYHPDTDEEDALKTITHLSCHSDTLGVLVYVRRSMIGIKCAPMELISHGERMGFESPP